MQDDTQKVLAILVGKKLWVCRRAADMATFQFGSRTRPQTILAGWVKLGNTLSMFSAIGGFFEETGSLSAAKTSTTRRTPMDEGPFRRGLTGSGIRIDEISCLGPCLKGIGSSRSIPLKPGFSAGSGSI